MASDLYLLLFLAIYQGCTGTKNANATSRFLRAPRARHTLDQAILPTLSNLEYIPLLKDPAQVLVSLKAQMPLPARGNAVRWSFYPGALRVEDS